MKQTFVIVINTDKQITESQIGVCVMDKLKLEKVVVVKTEKVEVVTEKIVKVI